MTENQVPPFIEKWIKEEYTWDLKSAVLLLHGIDPKSKKADLTLSGNSDPARVYAWARSKIMEGELKTIDEKADHDGSKVHILLRDVFIKWAFIKFTERAGPLHSAWKAYKASKNKPNPNSKAFKKAQEYQELLDAAYVEQYQSNPSIKKFNKSELCRKIAKNHYPGLIKDDQDSKAETIRRYTKSRDLNWVK